MAANRQGGPTDVTPPWTSQDLGTFDATLVSNGRYALRLIATDTGADGGNTTISKIVTVEVAGEAKIGNFKFSETDVVIPVSGIPITLTRSYDALNAARSADLGYGWELSIDSNLTEGRDVRTDLVVAMSASMNPGSYSIRTGPGRTPTQKAMDLDPSRDVWLNLPSGQRVKFTYSSDSGYGHFLSPEGVNATLAINGPNQMTYSDALQIWYWSHLDLTEGDLFGDGTTLFQFDQEAQLAKYDFPGYVLTMGDGTKFIYEKTKLTDEIFYSYTGDPASQSYSHVMATYANDPHLTQIIDVNGNTIDISKDGISSERVATAKLTFNRDSLGRLTSVVDSDGATILIQYTYNGQGDLVGVSRLVKRATVTTEATWATTNYMYEQNAQGSTHRLIGITDARGVSVMHLDYDPDTKRISTISDASGNTANFSYSLDGTQVGLPAGQTLQKTYDALGSVTEVVLDAYGNVVRQIQQTAPLDYLVTVMQYDSNNNRIATSKPHQVYETSTTSTLRYTWQPDPVTGFATRMAFGDGTHPDLPTSVTDAAGLTTTYDYNSQGNPTEVHEGSRVTYYTYDASGYQVLTTTDAAGTVSHYHYDAQGYPTSVEQTTAEGTVTVIQSLYNEAGLPYWIEDSVGQQQSLEYDENGNQTAMSYTGPGNQAIRVEKQYDEQGHLLGMRQLVNGQEVLSSGMLYDASGHMLTTTDQFGHATTNRYSANGQIVETRSPSKDQFGNDVMVVVRTAYDANGRVVAVTDPYLEGITPLQDLRVTHTFYDMAGRSIATRRLAGVTIGLDYNGGGQGADNLGGIFESSFAYDAATDTYAGVAAASVLISSTAQHYDDRGRVDWTQSATGLVTHTQYDEADRPTKVWFDMDINGDGTAEHQETSYGYDQYGQQISVTDPAGRVTEMIYDELGQVTHQILRGYVAPGVVPGSPQDNTSDDVTIQTIYDDQGHAIAEIDALGRQTDYEYDSGGRLLAVTLPQIDPTGSATGTVDHRRPRYEYHYDSYGKQSHIVANAYLDEATDEVVYVTRSADGTSGEYRRSASAAPSTWPTDKGRVTAFTYDGEGRQLTRTLPLGVQTTSNPNDFTESNVYDTATGATHGQLKYQVDFQGRVTAYLYDNSATGMGRLQSVRYYDSLSTYEADPNGTAASRKITTTYDAFGRAVTVTDSAFTTPTQYTYDADGRLIKIVSPQGTLHYAYDALGRKVATWTGSGDTLAEARSQATTLTEYGYDPLNRLTTTTEVRRFGANVDVDSNVAGIQPERMQTYYGLDGQIDYELIAANGGDMTRDFIYDSQGRVQSIGYFADANGNHAYDAGETLLSRFSYQYDADGSRQSETTVDQSGHTTTQAWVYDGLNHVTKDTFDGFDGQGNALYYTDTRPRKGGPEKGTSHIIARCRDCGGPEEMVWDRIAVSAKPRTASLPASVTWITTENLERILADHKPLSLPHFHFWQPPNRPYIMEASVFHPSWPLPRPRYLTTEYTRTP